MAEIIRSITVALKVDTDENTYTAEATGDTVEEAVAKATRDIQSQAPHTT